MLVIEDSVAEFVERWRHHAADCLIYPRPEGSPLIEARVAGRVLYLFDRSGPYSARPGEARLIVHPVAETIALSEAGTETLQSNGVSRIHAAGTVLEVGRGVVVVRALAPLVVGIFDDSWRRVSPGDQVSLESLEPVHGFHLTGGSG